MSDRANVVRMPGANLALPQPLAAICIRCKKELDASAFWRDSTKTNGLRSRCKDCMRQLESEFRASDPERYRRYEASRRRDPAKAKAYLEKYNLSGKGKLRSRLGSQRRRANKIGYYSKDEWESQNCIQGGRCYYCRKKFTKKRPPTIEHLVPLSRGGPHVASNIVAACGKCNSLKCAKLVVFI